MLRYVFRLHRRKCGDELEDWIAYMHRTAGDIRTLSAQYGLYDWVVEHRRRKYKFAGRVVRHSDQRWSQLVAEWNPGCEYVRSRGRPFLRWSDDLVAFAGSDWMKLARDEEIWASAEPGFTLRL